MLQIPYPTLRDRVEEIEGLILLPQIQAARLEQAEIMYKTPIYFCRGIVNKPVFPEPIKLCN